MNQTPLSVIVLAHAVNEKLVQAIESVKFADEIILIDTGIDLRWQSIKKNFEVKIVEMPGEISDFAAIRNQAMKHAKNDWLLFLDSDEQLAPASQPMLMGVIESSAAGAVFTRSDVFQGKQLEYGEAGNQQLIRMGRKGSMTFHGKVHETAAITGSLSYPKVTILHYAHDSVGAFIADVDRYAQLTAQTKQTSATRNLLEMVSYPVGKLLYGLFIQAGILDGWQGVTYAYCMALHSLLVRMYRYEIITKAAPNQKSS